MAPRGRGGKFSKPSRGGGKKFSRDLQPIDKDGNPVGLWREKEDKIASSSEEESSSEESSEEEGSDDADAGPSGQASASGDVSREARRAAAKAKKAAAIKRRGQAPAQPGDLPPSDSEASDEDLPANPNHSAKSRSQLVKPDSDAEPEQPVKKDPSQLSRREREAIEAQQARERYLKLHAEGKTDEARSDLARLAIIREQREAERERKLADKEEKEEQLRARAAAVKEREDKLRQAAMGKPKKGGKK
ncbi:uncharacterized protein N7482_009356 [Penicillium canariense]|uniref:Casein kinase substrate phosphoprotein PP28 domain-containing protein n=1 Tax=Penicillium canariense TaxID=189055 RepID=A0A9W9HPZ3_9EURO|nr:uncharacterized protein N7482_009356 [Penicillium canariense]KAJ5152878.1 hypothetical protein N7482_009356 [Penicillium canariense]